MRATAALLALLAVAPAFGAELSLPCHGPDGSPVAGTIVKAVSEASGDEPLQQHARDGVCRITLPAGAHWVKAEAPGMRSVAIRVVDASAPGRSLRLQPLGGRDVAAQQRLQQLVSRDQAVRHALQQAQAKGDTAEIEHAEREMEQADAASHAALIVWLVMRGFPRAADVGLDGVGAFWLLLQHAPDQLAPQLSALRAAAAAGELSRADLALSEDRVAMMAGRPQRYGSQLQPGPDGKPVLHPLADMQSVDALRAAMDLEPLAAYLRRFER